MDADRERINSVTQMIVGRAFTVENALGNGFAERVYENALAHELRKHGLHVEQQKAINVYYDGVLVGEYVADLIMQDVGGDSFYW